MNTASKLYFLLENRAALREIKSEYRIRLTASALMAKVIMSIPPGEFSIQLIGLRDKIGIT